MSLQWRTMGLRNIRNLSFGHSAALANGLWLHFGFWCLFVFFFVFFSILVWHTNCSWTTRMLPRGWASLHRNLVINVYSMSVLLFSLSLSPYYSLRPHRSFRCNFLSVKLLMIINSNLRTNFTQFRLVMTSSLFWSASHIRITTFSFFSSIFLSFYMKADDLWPLNPSHYRNFPLHWFSNVGFRTYFVCK